MGIIVNIFYNVIFYKKLNFLLFKIKMLNLWYNYILLILGLIPLIGSGCIVFVGQRNIKLIRKIALNSSLFTLVLASLLWVQFDSFFFKFQFITKIVLIPSLDLNIYLGLDGISLLFVLMESFLILTFTSLDLLMFYVFFETVLIPIFLIIGIWGPRRRRIRASLLLFFYTLFGSILMLFAILVINLQVGSFDYQLLFLCNFSEIKQKFLWLCFFLSFSAKIPMMPFHIWLPEAHVEAPTTGSVILAGILL